MMAGEVALQSTVLLFLFSLKLPFLNYIWLVFTALRFGEVKKIIANCFPIQ